jgi:hypothetical protein
MVMNLPTQPTQPTNASSGKRNSVEGTAERISYSMPGFAFDGAMHHQKQSPNSVSYVQLCEICTENQFTNALKSPNRAEKHRFSQKKVIFGRFASGRSF